jgi:probable rRNA maturation factor
MAGLRAARRIYTAVRNMEYLIELQQDIETDGVDAHALERTAAHALHLECVPAPAELSVLLADDVAVRELNRQYRHTDAATDVLSFSQAEGEEFAIPDGETPHLGDVVISVDTARRQAAEYGIPLQDELAHLVVHGVLHLLGYDHQDADGEEVMRAHEDAVLGGAHHH